MFDHTTQWKTKVTRDSSTEYIPTLATTNLDKMSFADDENGLFDGLMDVFTDEVMDDDSYTGGDWFALALSASHGGAAVHGVSFAPSSEILAKTTLEFAKKHAVGWVRINDKPLGEGSVTGTADGVYQANPPFRGIRTTNHIDTLTDTARWESSNATRAKHAAIVAATTESFGSTRELAKAFAEACVGGDLDDDVVESLVLPVSAMKRDAAGLGKANHSVYGRGTNQSMVTWSDTSLLSDALPHNASMDWARVTATARYIAEANMQLDDRFTEVANGRGIPYALINNSWAYVSPTDYLPPEDDWAEVKALGESVPGVPSLKGYYATAREDTYTTLVRALSLCDQSQASTVYEALVNALSLVKPKRVSNHKRNTTGTDLYASLSSHVLSADSAAQITRDTGTSWQTLVESFKALALQDKTDPVYKACEAAVLAVRNRKMDEEDTDVNVTTVITRVIKPDVWMLASHSLTAKLSNKATAELRMQRLFRNYVGSSATWDHPPRVGPKLLARAKLKTISLAKQALLGKMPTIPKGPVIGSIRAVSSLAKFNELLVNARAYLEKSKLAWSERYKKLANLYGVGDGRENRIMAIKYGAAAKAMMSLTPELLAAADVGFVLASKPMETYLWDMAKSYVKKRHMNWEVKPLLGIHAADAIAKHLDDAITATVTFADCETFSREKVAQLAKDLMEGVVDSLPTDEEPEVPKGPTEAEKKAEADMMALLEAEMMAMSAKPVLVKVTLDAVERSYPEDADLEMYARANGYKSFEEAFDKLGDKAAYDTENEFTKKGLAIAHKKASEEGPKPVLDDAMF